MLVERRKRSNLKRKDMETEDSSTNLEDSIDSYIFHFSGIINGTKNDKKMLTSIEVIKGFPKAVILSFMLSSVIIMEGYNTNLTGGYFAFPNAQEKYGSYYPGLGFKSIAKWRTVLNMVNGFADILVALAATYITEKYGLKKSINRSLFLIIVLIYVVFVTDNSCVLAVAEVLLRIPLGVYQSLAISYSTEICPFIFRTYLAISMNICWLIGQLISFFMLKGVIPNDIIYINKFPFSIQWYWLISIIMLSIFLPESPRWLAKQGKIKEAKCSFLKLLSGNKLPKKDIFSDRILEKFQLNNKEEEIITNDYSFWDFFRGNDFNCIIKASVISLIQSISYITLLLLSTYVCEQGYLSPSLLLTFNVFKFLLLPLGKACSSVVSQNAKKYHIYFTGLCVQCIFLIIIGILSLAQSASNCWIGLLLLMFTFVHDSIARPVYSDYVLELSSLKLHSKISFIASKISIIGIISTLNVIPHLLNSINGSSVARTGFFWGSLALITSVWCYLELLEVKEKQIKDLNLLIKD